MKIFKYLFNLLFGKKQKIDLYPYKYKLDKEILQKYGFEGDYEIWIDRNGKKYVSGIMKIDNETKEEIRDRKINEILNG